MAISIPIFTAQLEKAREATDISNIRAAYAEASAAAITDSQKNESLGDGTTITYTAGDPGKYSVEVPLKQAKVGWETSNPECAGVSLSTISKKSGQSVTVTVGTDGTVSIQ